MDKRENCFNLIRFLAAFQVFLGHACEHLEVQMPKLMSEIWFCFRGVPIFFVLSGFLIWNSLEKEQNLKSYCSKRVIRLYPELWGGVLLNAVIIAVVYGEYINVAPFFLFQFTQATIFQFWTPDCLKGYGCGTPNGALWTIGVMVQSYIVIFILHKYLHKKRPMAFITMLVIGVSLNIGIPILENFLPEIYFKLLGQTFLPYIWLFILGGLVCEYFDTVIGLLKRFWWLIFMLSVMISITHLEDGIGFYETMKSATLGLSILGFGYAFSSIKITHDFSYGFYIYHMVVINLMIESEFIAKPIFIMIAFLISSILAVLSFYVTGSIRQNMKKRIA